MSWPKIAFVAAPDLAAAVRLDLAQANVWVAAEDLDIGVPKFDGAPEVEGFDYGYRDMSLTVHVRGTKAAALAVQQQLAREVLRWQNWLLVQLQAGTAPVWFKTWRTQPGKISLDEVYDDTAKVPVPDEWEIQVPLAATGFGYGARETQAAVTVNNDPAAAGNPCRFVLPQVLGDAPTAARVAVNPSNRGAVGGYRWLIHLHSTKAADNPITLQVGTGDGWTVGADVAAATTDAAYSGGSYRAISFTTQTGLVDRISGNTAVAVPAGRYKVMARVARSDTSSMFSMRFGQFNFIGYLYGPTKTMARAASTAAGHATWVDLGDFTFPMRTGIAFDDAGAAQTQNIAVQVGRLSGTGAARLDALRFIPLEAAGTIDSSTLVTDLPLAALFDGAGRDVWDGDTESYWKVDAAGNAIQLARPDMMGGFPVLQPGAVNTLTVLPQANGTAFVDDNSDSIAATTSVVVSYHPRYLYLRGD